MLPLSTDQVTTELKLPVPVIAAEHFDVWFTWTEEGKQEVLTEVIVGWGCPPPTPLFPPQADSPRQRIRAKREKRRYGGFVIQHLLAFGSRIVKCSLWSEPNDNLLK
jgi:hypothetical protein